MAFEKKSDVLENVVAQAHEELNTIGAEMQDDFDEKGERWQESDRGQEILSAAEHFSGLDYPEPPDHLKSITVEYQQVVHKRPNRVERRDNSLHAIQAVIAAIAALKEENDENEAYVNDLDQLVSDAESIDPEGR
jgi:nitrate reductase assembly molybdenum cofactor insertion protein NarJ